MKKFCRISVWKPSRSCTRRCCISQVTPRVFPTKEVVSTSIFPASGKLLLSKIKTSCGHVKTTFPWCAKACTRSARLSFKSQATDHPLFPFVLKDVHLVHDSASRRNTTRKPIREGSCTAGWEQQHAATAKLCFPVTLFLFPSYTCWCPA